MQIKVTADPEQPRIQFGADIQADGSESLNSDAVSLRTKKKKKKKVKTTGGDELPEKAQENTLNLLQNRIIEVQKEEDEGEFEFTMIGDGKPPEPVKKAQEDEDQIEITGDIVGFSPFGKRKAKKKKKSQIPNFDDLEDLEVFNI